MSDHHSECSFDGCSDVGEPVENAFDTKIIKELEEIRKILEAVSHSPKVNICNLNPLQKPSDLQAAHEALITRFSNLTTEHQELRSDAHRTISTYKAQLKDLSAMARASDEKRKAVEAELAEVTKANANLMLNVKALQKEIEQMVRMSSKGQNLILKLPDNRGGRSLENLWGRCRR